MEFDAEVLSNKLFADSILTFDRRTNELPDGIPSDVGSKINKDGSLKLCIYAPACREVKVTLATSGKRVRNLLLKQDEKGVFRGGLPFDEDFTGPVNVEVFYDGLQKIEPYLPIIWTNNRPFNCIEIPDPQDEYLLIKDTPHGGVTREIFWAEPMKNWERCFVYTPPGYMSGHESYPVLYLLNGGTDNDTSWEYVGRLSHIMDNLIAEKKCVPCIVAAPNSMLRKDGEVSSVRDSAFEDMLLNNCIPYIEKTYRAKTGKWNRAIAGLSMGSYMTCDIAMGYPEKFGYVGHFTASMTHEDEKKQYKPEYIRPYRKFLQETSPEQFAEYFKIYFRSTTPQEDHLPFFESDDELMHRAGFDRENCYHRILYSEHTSKWNSWRLGLRDFVKLIFR